MVAVSIPCCARLFFSSLFKLFALSPCSVVDDMIRRYTRGPCVLDGELIVWNKKE